MEKHFTVSIFIVRNQKVLLHLYKKANKILPLGGHVEINELPEETAIREAKEESGLEVTLFDKNDSVCIKNVGNEKVLVNPMYTMLVEINPEHYHVDFIYYAYANSDILNPRKGESTQLKWYLEDEIDSDDNIPYNVKQMAKEALNLLKDRSN